MKLHPLLAVTTLFAGFATSALAQSVDIKNAWVRASVQGQSATGAFMTLTSREDVRLVGVISPVAGVAEVHEMKMDNGIMKMRAVEGGLALPDSTVPMTLVFKDAKGVESRVELKLPVATGPMAHKH